MNVQLFKIRPEEVYLPADQKKLDCFLAENEILKYETAFVTADESYWSVMVFYNPPASVNESQPPKYTAADAELTTGETKILEALRAWRAEKAGEKNLPPYLVATNKELLSLAKYRPVTIRDFSEIKGFGRYKIEHYGQEILEILERV